MAEQSDHSYQALLKRLVITNQKRKGDLKQISCEFCLKDITGSTYTQCMTCKNFFICLYCYSKGSEKTDHAISHKYYIIDQLKFPLFIFSWSGKEELLLLENLLKLGYGNWVSISEALGGAKTPSECESHYKQIYLNQKVPDLQKYNILSYKDPLGYIKQNKSQNTNLFKYFKIEDDNYTIEKRNDTEKNFLSDFVGFMPLRKDFEIEFENDIETYLADLEFYDDDRPEDVEIKLNQLKVYLKVLDEREERKNFVMERWPLETKIEKKMKNVFERNAYYSIKPFARLLPFDKHQVFCDALVKENLLKLKLEELKEARSKGIKTEEDFKKFLSQKKNIFVNKIKEYEILSKEIFSYKIAEAQKSEIISNLDQSRRIDADVEADFCQRIGINLEEFTGLKDKIAGNMENKFSDVNENTEDESYKREFIDFIVKSKGV
jgi:transcriptional adapter 2-alpha